MGALEPNAGAPNADGLAALLVFPKALIDVLPVLPVLVPNWGIPNAEVVVPPVIVFAVPKLGLPNALPPMLLVLAALFVKGLIPLVLEGLGLAPDVNGLPKADITVESLLGSKFNDSLMSFCVKVQQFSVIVL